MSAPDVVLDAIRELLIGHLESQGFARSVAEDKVSKNASALQVNVDEVLGTETSLDQQ